MNEKNLIPTTQRTESELRAMTSKGGRESGRVRMGLKGLSEDLKRKGDDPAYDKSGKAIRDPVTGRHLTWTEAIGERVVQGCLDGNPKMIELYCRLTGQLQQIAIANFPTVTFLLGDQEQNKTIDTDAEEIP